MLYGFHQVCCHRSAAAVPHPPPSARGLVLVTPKTAPEINDVKRCEIPKECFQSPLIRVVCEHLLPVPPSTNVRIQCIGEQGQKHVTIFIVEEHMIGFLPYGASRLTGESVGHTTNQHNMHMCSTYITSTSTEPSNERKKVGGYNEGIGCTWPKACSEHILSYTRNAMQQCQPQFNTLPLTTYIVSLTYHCLV